MLRSVLLGVVLAGLLAGCGSSSASPATSLFPITTLATIPDVGKSPPRSTPLKQVDTYLQVWLARRLDVSRANVSCTSPMALSHRRLLMPCTERRSGGSPVEIQVTFLPDRTFHVTQMVTGGSTSRVKQRVVRVFVAGHVRDRLVAPGPGKAAPLVEPFRGVLSSEERREGRSFRSP
jgi:hypothetical protein